MSAGALAEGGGLATVMGLLCGQPFVEQFSVSEYLCFASAYSNLKAAAAAAAAVAGGGKCTSGPALPPLRAKVWGRS